MNKFIPYLGRRWAPDFNCWDFVREYYQRELAITLEPHPITVANAVREAHEAVTSEARGDTWFEQDNPQPGDVAVFGRSNLSYHVGLCVDRNTVLHLPENAPSCAVPLRRLLTSFNSVKFYRHTQLL